MSVLFLSLALAGCGEERELSCEDYFVETYNLDTIDHYGCSLSHMQCGATAVERSVSTRVEGGGYQERYASDETVELVARLENNTDEEVSYTSVGCLVNSIDIDGPETGVSISADCFSETTWTLESGETLEAAVEGMEADRYGEGLVRAQLIFSSSEGNCCRCTQWRVE